MRSRYGPQRRGPGGDRSAETTRGSAGPSALVLGDMDLIRSLVLAGTRPAAVLAPGDPARHSRYVTPIGSWDPTADNASLVELLVRWSRSQESPPVLFYQNDDQLRFVSAHRDRLATAYRFTIDDAERVGTLLEKDRFQELAESLSLPIPPGQLVVPEADRPGPDLLSLPFPLVLKPTERADHLWRSVAPSGKALLVETGGALEELWPRLVLFGRRLLAQQYIEGPESSIESYHVYVGSDGSVVAEFTGRKIRTLPVAFGDTTALVITDSDEVKELGRAVITAIGLRGVAKVDLKRGPDGRLRLLEVNPRFNLWHHPGAVAGVNLPGLVYADLLGLPRPPVGPVQAGVRWCRPSDVLAARAHGVPLRRWVPWVVSCDAKYTWARDDPLPFLLAAVRPPSASPFRASLRTRSAFSGP
jgi:D-aspartate ligase